MTHLKNIVVGFGVSFIGSIPLGYLNVIGFDIYTQNGLLATVRYLLGVVLIEMFVIYFTLIFAKTLADKQKLTQVIEIISIIFMFLLAAVFYLGSNTTGQPRTIFNNIQNHYFMAGLLLSSLNFIQIPFWTGWNLWLMSGQHIKVTGNKKLFYISGTVLGTFGGMLTLIISLHYFASNIEFLSQYLMKIIIPFVFLCLGIFQSFKFFQKYCA